jgi:hypothetical protein
MKRSYFIFLTLLTLFACSEKVDNRVTENMDVYKSAKDYLINNVTQIDKSRIYTRHDSAMRNAYRTIFASNKYYFENTLVLEYPGLKDLLDLWDKNLIENDKVVHALILKTDSVIKFTIKSDIGTFSGTSHILIYDPNNCCEDHIDEYSEIKFESELEDDWYYIVRKKYYAY